MGVKFGVEERTFGFLLYAKFYPHRCNMSPLWGEKPQNRPLSNLNNRRFALRAMLPVNEWKWNNINICAVSTCLVQNITESLACQWTLEKMHSVKQHHFPGLKTTIGCQEVKSSSLWKWNLKPPNHVNACTHVRHPFMGLLSGQPG